jgi:hypothetical protein
VSDKRRWRGSLVWISLAGVIVVLAVILVVPVTGSDCAALMEPGEAPLMLPANCTRMKKTSESANYFESQRKERGLNHDGWIVCSAPSDGGAWERAIQEDHRWLPSYVPGAYQWRRTVLLLPYGPSSRAGSHLVAEICLMPRWKYIRQIYGQCDEKFAVWK